MTYCKCSGPKQHCQRWTPVVYLLDHISMVCSGNFQLRWGIKYSQMSFSSFWVFLQILKAGHAHKNQPHSPCGVFLSSNITMYHSSLFLLVYIDVFEFTWTEIIVRFLNAFCFHVHYIINQFHFILDVILLQNIEKTLSKWNYTCLILKI